MCNILISILNKLLKIINLNFLINKMHGFFYNHKIKLFKIKKNFLN